uniref:Uncharacterized protein n=1 Tax=Glossina brevipalpis TaxID=37001 RepID=A0A1A9W1T8_9MUSC
MKSILALVILALAASVQSSLLTAQVAPGVSYVTHGAAFPYGGVWPGAYGAVDFSAGAPWVYGAHGAWGGYPGIGLSQGPGVGYGHGVYTAKTRGAVHTAPLAGHVNSATSVNVAPAPGTH